MDCSPVPGRYLVEWYTSETGQTALDEAVARLTGHAEAAGVAVQLLMTLAVPADDVVFGVFAASSAEAVSRLCEQAGIPAQRLSAAIENACARVNR